MSGRGNCYDNAMMESFWRRSRRELIHQQKYTTHEQARQSIFEYIEVFYNRKRLHSSLGYVSPESFERPEHSRRAPTGMWGSPQRSNLESLERTRLLYSPRAAPTRDSCGGKSKVVSL